MPNDIRSAALRKPAIPSDEDWMSVTATAKLLGCALQTVYNRALRGELEHMRFANRLYISRASAEISRASAQRFFGN